MQSRTTTYAASLVGCLASALGLALAACGGHASTSSLGIPDCDTYLAKVDACFAKNASLRSTMAPVLRARRDAWKQMAARDRTTLASQCKNALAALPSAMPGCP